jgi:hypothetical protein
VIAGATIGFAMATGRADSTLGQSAMKLADIDVESLSGSVVLQ